MQKKHPRSVGDAFPACRQKTLFRHLNLFQPLRNPFRVAAHRSETFQVLGVGSQFRNLGEGFVTVGRGVGAERDDGLAPEVVAFGEGVDNHRGSPPPYGATIRGSR